MREDELQKLCVSWMRLQHKDVLFYAVPNEAKRSYRLATHLRSMGMTSGVPDLVICSSRHGYHGMYIELKVGRNKLTKNQKEILTKLREENYMAVEVRDSLEEFQSVVNSYLNG